jgi:hypothetical protein
MVRNRSMRKARYWKNRLIESERGTAMRPTDPTFADGNMRYYVRRARQAHREWRKWREYDRREREAEQRFNSATTDEERIAIIREVRA